MLLTGAALGVGSTAGTPAAAAGPSVLLVGDSVMAAFNYSYGAGGVAAVATGYSPTVDARVCRTLVRPSCLAGVSTALQVLQAWRGRLPPLVVIGAGYNDWSIGPAIDAIMQEATNQGARAVVWLTYQDVTSASHYAANNAAVVAATARWPKLRVGHWDTFSEGKAAWFNSDGVHLSGAGSSAYGQLIKATLDAVPPALDPRCNPATAIGAVAPPLAGLPPNAPSTGARLTPLNPARLVDTRPGAPDDGVAGRVGSRRVLDVVVAGRGGVPPDATGAVLNVTIVEPCAAGFATVYPAGAPNPPLASSSNYRAFENVAAMATTKLGAGGAVSIFTSAQADVVVDVVGYVHPTQGSLFNAVTPSRVHDVRPARLVAGQEVTIPVRGVGTVPGSAGVTGAVLNLTVNAPSGAGFLTLYPGPCSPGARPLASNLNYAVGQTVANAVVTALGANGSVCVFSLVGAEVIVDATGWLGGSGSGFFGVAPQRLVDTRPGEGAAHMSIKGRVQPGAPLVVPVGTSSGVPGSANAVALNVTAVSPSAAGFLTAHPCDAPAPTSTVNYVAGDIRPNMVLVRSDANDRVCLSTLQPTDVVVDLLGWFA